MVLLVAGVIYYNFSSKLQPQAVLAIRIEQVFFTALIINLVNISTNLDLKQSKIKTLLWDDFNIASTKSCDGTKISERAYQVKKAILPQHEETGDNAITIKLVYIQWRMAWKV